jgi:hypothetical protein
MKTVALYLQDQGIDEDIDLGNIIIQMSDDDYLNLVSDFMASESLTIVGVKEKKEIQEEKI